MKHQEHNRRFLLLLTILLVATFGMAQTVIVKDSITNHKGANGFEMALFIPYDSTKISGDGSSDHTLLLIF